MKRLLTKATLTVITLAASTLAVGALAGEASAGNLPAAFAQCAEHNGPAVPHQVTGEATGKYREITVNTPDLNRSYAGIVTASQSGRQGPNFFSLMTVEDSRSGKEITLHVQGRLDGHALKPDNIAIGTCDNESLNRDTDREKSSIVFREDLGPTKYVIVEMTASLQDGGSVTVKNH
jgi:hypothetical protein